MSSIRSWQWLCLNVLLQQLWIQLMFNYSIAVRKMADSKLSLNNLNAMQDIAGGALLSHFLVQYLCRLKLRSRYQCPTQCHQLEFQVVWSPPRSRWQQFKTATSSLLCCFKLMFLILDFRRRSVCEKGWDTWRGPQLLRTSQSHHAWDLLIIIVDNLMTGHDTQQSSRICGVDHCYNWPNSSWNAR